MKNKKEMTYAELVEQVFLDVDEADLLKLAVCLRRNADDKKIWDAAIDRIGIIPCYMIDHFVMVRMKKRED